MIIIYGSKLYGKVDVVPGLFHVETKFGHLWYIPLVPVASYVVFGKSGDGFNGVQIPMSFKSICYAWLRAGSLVATIVSGIYCLSEWKNGPSEIVTPAIVGLSSLATCIVLSFHKGSTHASYRRAHQIGTLIGMSPEGFLHLEKIYGTTQESAPDPFGQEKADRFNADL